MIPQGLSSLPVLYDDGGHTRPKDPAFNTESDEYWSDSQDWVYSELTGS